MKTDKEIRALLSRLQEFEADEQIPWSEIARQLEFNKKVATLAETEAEPNPDSWELIKRNLRPSFFVRYKNQIRFASAAVLLLFLSFYLVNFPSDESISEIGNTPKTTTKNAPFIAKKNESSRADYSENTTAQAAENNESSPSTENASDVSINAEAKPLEKFKIESENQKRTNEKKKLQSQSKELALGTGEKLNPEKSMNYTVANQSTPDNQSNESNQKLSSVENSLNSPQLIVNQEETLTKGGKIAQMDISSLQLKEYSLLNTGPFTDKLNVANVNPIYPEYVAKVKQALSWNLELNPVNSYQNISFPSGYSLGQIQSVNTIQSFDKKRAGVLFGLNVGKPIFKNHFITAGFGLGYIPYNLDYAVASDVYKLSYLSSGDNTLEALTSKVSYRRERLLLNLSLINQQKITKSLPLHIQYGFVLSQDQKIRQMALYATTGAQWQLIDKLSVGPNLLYALNPAQEEITGIKIKPFTVGIKFQYHLSH